MTTIAEKVAYVRGQRRHDGTHRCHWPGCARRFALVEDQRRHAATLRHPPLPWSARTAAERAAHNRRRRLMKGDRR